MSNLTGHVYNWISIYGTRILFALLFFFIGQWLIKILNRSFKKILSTRRISATLKPFLQNLLQTILQVLMILGLMQILGIRMTVFAAVIGAFGVAVGLALSGTLQNFAAGVLIIVLKPFVVGDNITTQGEEGTVVYIRLFYTVVRTFNNTTLIVPNSKLSNEVIFNLTREQTRRLEISIKFNYDVEFSEVKSVILNTIGSYEKCLKEPAPRVGVEKIEMDCYTVLVNAWMTSHEFRDASLHLNEQLMHALKPLLIKA